MIAAGEPGLSVEGLTLFRDRADPLQWYFWPDKPRLQISPDGKPAFRLTKYRKDPATLAPGADSGGAIVTVTFDLAVGAEALASAALAIQRQSDAPQAPRLAPLVPRSGSARFVFLDEAPALAGSGTVPPPAQAPASGHVERASYLATPSLTAPETATFSLSLNVPGTGTLETAMSAGERSLAGIVYDITVDCLEAPSGFVVSAAWDRVNATLQNRFGGSAGTQPLVTLDDIEDAIAGLIATGLVKLTASGGSAAALGDARAPNRLTRFVVDSFFIPSLAPPQAPPPPNALFAPAYVFRGVPTDALAALDEAVNATGPVAAHFNAQARLGELLAPYPAASLVTEVDLSDSFFKTIDVHVVLAGSLAADRIAAVEVSLSYNGQQMTRLLTEGQPSAEARWTFDAAAGNSYSYAYKILFLEGSPLASATMQSTAATLALAPRSLYALQTTVVQDVGVPFERYAKVDVELGYGDRPDALDPRGLVTLTPSQRSGNWAVRLANGQKPGYQSRLTYYPIGGAPLVGPWIAGTAPMLAVGDFGA